MPRLDSWDTHAANFGPLKNLHCPKLDRGLSALLEDMDQRGLLKETLVVAIGEFGRSPRMGVSTSGNTQLARWPRSLAVLLQRGRGGLRHRARRQYGESDQTASSPKRSRCIRTICWRRSTTRSASTPTWWCEPSESAARAGEG